MKSDGAVRVDHLHQVMDHAVAVGRNRFISKNGLPLSHPLVLGLANFRNHFLFNASLGWPDPVAHRLDQVLQRQLGVGQDGHVGLVDLVQVPWIGVDMDQLDVGRYGPAVGGVGHSERVTHRQHRVGLAVHVQGLARSVLAPGIHTATQRQRMVFGESALAHQSAGHRHGQQLGNLSGLVPCLGRQDAAAHVQYGEAGINQNIGGLVYVSGVGRCLASGSHRFVVQNIVGSLTGEDIQGHFQDHRAGGTGTQSGERPAHYRRDILHSGHGALPLDETVEDAGRHLLLYLFPHVAQRMLSHEQQHGHVIGEGGGNPGQGVGGPGPGPAQRHADLAGCPSITVGYFHSLALVPSREYLYGLGGSKCRPKGHLAAAREPRNILNTLLLKGVNYCIASAHGVTS